MDKWALRRSSVGRPLRFVRLIYKPHASASNAHARRLAAPHLSSDSQFLHRRVGLEAPSSQVLSQFTCTALCFLAADRCGRGDGSSTSFSAMAHTSDEPADSDMARALQEAAVSMQAACASMGLCHAAAMNGDPSCRVVLSNLICSILLYRDLLLRLASDILRDIKSKLESFLNNDDATIKANIAEFASTTHKYPELLKQLTDFSVHLLKDLKLQKRAAEDLQATYDLQQRASHRAAFLQAITVAEKMEALYVRKKTKWTTFMFGVAGFSIGTAVFSGGILLPLSGGALGGGAGLAWQRKHEYKQLMLVAKSDLAAKAEVYNQALLQGKVAAAAIRAIQELLLILANCTEAFNKVAGFFRVLQSDVTSNNEAADNLASQANPRRSFLYLLRLKNSLKSTIAACDQFINYYGTTVNQISTIQKYIEPGTYNWLQDPESWCVSKQLPALQDSLRA